MSEVEEEIRELLKEVQALPPAGRFRAGRITREWIDKLHKLVKCKDLAA